MAIKNEVNGKNPKVDEIFEKKNNILLIFYWIFDFDQMRRYKQPNKVQNKKCFKNKMSQMEERKNVKTNCQSEQGVWRMKT